MSRRNALPPLPGKYRSAGALPEEYGFRWGAFAMSFVFLVLGGGVLLNPPLHGLQLVAISAALLAVFLVSAWASRLWSDQPVQGLRRLMADLPFIVLGIAGFAGAGFMAYGLFVLTVRLVAMNPIALALIAPVLGVLLVLMKRTGVVDLMRVSIASYMTSPSRGMTPPLASGEEQLTYLETVRRVRFWHKQL